MFRRGIFILGVAVVLLLTGAGALLMNPTAASESAAGLGLHRIVGICSFFAAAAVGIFGFLSHRAAVARLVTQLREMQQRGQLSRTEAKHPDLGWLVGSINDMVESAEQVVKRASLEVKELEIQLKVATAERQHAEAIIYSISDAVLVTDSFDDVVLANDSAAKTFGFDLAKASRSPVSQVLTDAKMIDLLREMRQSNSRNGRRIVEHQVNTAEGTRVFKVTLSSVADQTDSPAGVVAVFHDMTREKEVAQMKNDFVSNVSHELRTPLASIRAYVEMLIDGEAEDEKTQREFYEVIQGEANRLGRLIDNILNISRIESGLVKINKQPQSLAVILKEAVEVITPQSKLKHIKLIEKAAPVFYQTFADKDMLYQAVLNLLSNAVKYTPENGQITVETQVDEAKKKVITRISDTGVGIPAKDLPFVFDKFYRAEANNHMAKGTGLGLSLVKQIVEGVHHGRIFVESHVGKGSTFGIELDLCD